MKTVPAMVLAASLTIPVGPLLPLTGCASALNSAGIVTPANITEAQTLISGLAKIYAAVKADYPALIPAGGAADNEVTTALASAMTAVDSLSTLASAGGNATALGTISTAAVGILNVLADALPVVGVPPEVTLGLQAAQLLLPDLMVLRQTVAPSTAVPTAAMTMLPARFNNSGLTKDAALSVLAAAR